MPLISKDFIRNKLMPRIDIVKLIQQYRTLKLSGANYKCCCPFHNEKTPSFMVSPSHQTFRCFGCNEHGNAIDFVMKYNNSSFVEAVEELARFAGVDVEYDKNSDYDPKKADMRQGLYKMMDDAAYYFTRCLQQNAEAMAYFKEKRGLSEEIIVKARLGYAPDNFEYVEKELTKNGEEYSKAVECGLQKDMFEEGRHRKYAFFRNRVMFPIFDVKGRIIAFGGRVLGDEKTAKYLNSPETPIFKKSREIFGLYECLQANRNRPETIVVVEGYMDAIALRQAGYNNIVATLGTALTSEHMQALFRYTNEVIFCFDSDEAGKKAGWHAMQVITPLLKETEKSVRFLFLPAGHDPDTFVRSNGNDAFGVELKKALSLTETIFLYKTKEFDLSHVSGRIEFIRNVATIIKAMPFNYQFVARQLLSEILQMDPNEVNNMIDDPTIEVDRSFLPQPTYSNRSANTTISTGYQGQRNQDYQFSNSGNRGQGQRFSSNPSSQRGNGGQGQWQGRGANGEQGDRSAYRNNGQNGQGSYAQNGQRGYSQGTQGGYNQGGQGRYNNGAQGGYSSQGGNGGAQGGSYAAQGSFGMANGSLAGNTEPMGSAPYYDDVPPPPADLYGQSDNTDGYNQWPAPQRNPNDKVIRYERPKDTFSYASSSQSGANASAAQAGGYQTTTYGAAGQSLSVDQFRDQLYIENAQRTRNSPAGNYMHLGPDGSPISNDHMANAGDENNGEYFEGGRGPNGNLQERQVAWESKWGPSAELMQASGDGASGNVDIEMLKRQGRIDPNFQEPISKNKGLYSYEIATYQTVVGRDFSVSEASGPYYELVAFVLQQPTIVATLYDFFKLDDFLAIAKQLKFVEYPCLERLFELIKNEPTITCAMLIEEFRDTQFWSLFNYLFDLPVLPSKADSSDLSPEFKSEHFVKFIVDSLKEPFLNRLSKLHASSNEDLEESMALNEMKTITYDIKNQP